MDTWSADHWSAEHAPREEAPRPGAAHHAARLEAESFRKVFSEGPLGMAIVDLDGRIVKPNSALCRMLGYAEQELTGLTFADVTYADDVDLNRHLLQQLLRGEMPYFQMEKRYVRKNGGILWARLTASLVRDDEGKPLYGVGMVEDIAERKRLEQQRERVERLQREFFFLVSHELRTPLTVAIAHLDTAGRHLATLEEAASRKSAEHLEKGRAAVWRLAEMVEELLAVTAIDIGRLSLTQEAVFLPELIGEVLTRLQPLAVHHRLRVELPQEFPLALLDRAQIRRVVANLVGNATKYTPAGTTITVHLDQQGDEAVVSVSDQGPGIAADALPCLFDRFSRVHAADLGLGEGLGLGLYVNKAVVEAHGGRMWVESEPGRGSIFYFALPLA